MKFTYIFNPETENMLQTDYPKLIFNKNAYIKYDIPHILKEITSIDKIDLSNLEKKEKETFNQEVSATILKKWLEIENSIFFELDKFYYAFFYFYSNSKKYFIVSCIKKLIKFVYDPNLNFLSQYKNYRTIKEFCSLYDINSAKDCLKKIFSIFEAIESFLCDMRYKIRILNNKSDVFKQILKDRIFSYDVTVFTLYLVFRDFFREKEDVKFFKKNLEENFNEKKEKYKKKHDILNMKFNDKRQDDYLDTEYMNNMDRKLFENVNIKYLMIIFHELFLNKMHLGNIFQKHISNFFS